MTVHVNDQEQVVTSLLWVSSEWCRIAWSIPPGKKKEIKNIVRGDLFLSLNWSLHMSFVVSQKPKLRAIDGSKYGTWPKREKASTIQFYFGLNWSPEASSSFRKMSFKQTWNASKIKQTMKGRKRTQLPGQLYRILLVRKRSPLRILRRVECKQARQNKWCKYKIIND